MNTHIVIVEIRGRSSMDYVADYEAAKKFAAYYRPKIGKGQILSVNVKKIKP